MPELWLSRLLQPEAGRLCDPGRRRTTAIILLKRGFDPGKDLWTFPGGFVDLGESVEQAAHREVDEELGIRIELHDLVGVYSRPQERVVLVVYGARALGAPRRTPEAIDVRAFEPTEIPWDELAFWSTGLALRDFLARRGNPVAAETGPVTPGS